MGVGSDRLWGPDDTRTIRAVDAQADSSGPNPMAGSGGGTGDPIVAGLLAWLVPGLGHLYLGRLPKALLLGGSVCVVFLAGMLIGGYGVVSWTHKPYWFVGHAFGGTCTGLAWLLGRPHLAADPTAAHELGLLYTCVASLCNFLLVLDAASTAVRDRRPAAA